jgi:RHS repeat-associated protein
MSNTARRQSVTYPNGRVVNLGYGSSDSIDDLFSLVKSAAISGESGNKVEYSRAGLGRFVKITYPQPGVEMSMIRPGGGSMGDSGDPYDGYDRFGRVQEMRWQSSSTGTPIDAWQWGYNEASNRTWKKNLVATSGQDEAYGYDGLYQVIRDAVGTLNTNRTSIGGVPAEDEGFSYDRVGNWLAYRKDANGSPVLDQTRSNNRDNQLTQIDGDSALLAYDRAGNATKTAPGVGGDWTKHFANTWDAWNRLVEVKDENGTSVQKNAYDGLTRRITKESGGTVTHTYWSDRWKPLEERIGSATTTARSYLWGERPGHRDELVLRDRDTDGNGSLDERLYATMDYFNGTAVLNTSGVVQERYAYSAFGVRRIMAADFSPRSTSSHAWEFGFQGQFRDAETGWYNYGYRIYVSLLGRWINRDPIRERGGVNLYGFVGNFTINRVDYVGKVWSNSMALAHYFAEGGDVTLSHIGGVGVVTSSIQPKIDGWKTQTRDAAHAEGKMLSCSDPLSSMEIITDFDSVGASSGVLWIGGFSLYRSYVCDIQAHCESCTYSFSCSIELQMNDKFEEPLNFNGKLSFDIAPATTLDIGLDPITFAWPDPTFEIGGLPFNVSHTWNYTEDGGGKISGS